MNTKYKVGQHVINNDKHSWYNGREVLITGINTEFDKPIYHCQAGNVTMSLAEKDIKELKYKD